MLKQAFPLLVAIVLLFGLANVWHGSNAHSAENTGTQMTGVENRLRHLEKRVKVLEQTNSQHMLLHKDDAKHDATHEEMDKRVRQLEVHHRDHMEHHKKDAKHDAAHDEIEGRVALLEAKHVAVPGLDTVGNTGHGTEGLAEASHQVVASPNAEAAATLSKVAAPTEKELVALEESARAAVVALKRAGSVMEEEPAALAATGKLQAATRELLLQRYRKLATQGGPDGAKGTVFHVKLQVEFPPTQDDVVEKGATGTVLVETAPLELMPHAVHTFLELVRTWKGGAFHRNAGHVLQAHATAGGRAAGLAFQEYSPKYPHVEGTLGFAGRPGGPAFYISTVDNTRNHGPASQVPALSTHSTTRIRLNLPTRAGRPRRGMRTRRTAASAASCTGEAWCSACSKSGARSSTASGRTGWAF